MEENSQLKDVSLKSNNPTSNYLLTPNRNEKYFTPIDPNINIQIEPGFALEKLNKLKVVLLHDWLTGFRGGERVLEIFCKMFPNAPLYTLIYKPQSTSPIIENRTIISSILNQFPRAYLYYRKLLPLYPFAVKTLRPPKYSDLIISSSHCVIKGVKPFSLASSTRPFHLSYIHSPMRYIYDQFENYFGPDSGASKLEQLVGKIVRNYLISFDLKSNKDVDVLVANSNFVQERIRRNYGRDAYVIHPFVDLKDFKTIQLDPPKKENYYLIVSAFAPNKRVDLAITAIINYEKIYGIKPSKLIIVGSGQQEKYLKALANNSPLIQFFGNLGRSEIIELLAKAKALIFPGVEDFGIVPLEALASGTPIIAFKKGGVLETLNDDVAEFFEEETRESLLQAIFNFEHKTIDQFKRETLIQRANQFTPEKFMEKMSTLLYYSILTNPQKRPLLS